MIQHSDILTAKNVHKQEDTVNIILWENCCKTFMLNAYYINVYYTFQCKHMKNTQWTSILALLKYTKAKNKATMWTFVLFCVTCICLVCKESTGSIYNCAALKALFGTLNHFLLAILIASVLVQPGAQCEQIAFSVRVRIAQGRIVLNVGCTTPFDPTECR